MPLVKFVATPSPNDQTQELKLKDDEQGARSLVLGGDALEVSGSELVTLLANGYQIEIVSEEAADEEQAPAPVQDFTAFPPQQSPEDAFTQPDTPGA